MTGEISGSWCCNPKSFVVDTRSASSQWRKMVFDRADSKTIIWWLYKDGITLLSYLELAWLEKVRELIIPGRAQPDSTVQGRIHFPARYNLPTSMSLHQVASIRFDLSPSQTKLHPYKFCLSCSTSDTYIGRSTWSVSPDTYRAFDRVALWHKAV